MYPNKVMAVCFLLMLLVSLSQARPEGATNTSCYAHTITHTIFDQPLTPDLCTANTRCSGLTLTPSCPTLQDDICCRNFNSNILYTNCNYTFQWSSGTNLGFLVQARINPDPSNTMLDPNSTIVGRWDSGDSHKTLNCRDSMNSNEQPVPNSVTHSRVYQESDSNAPSSISMTWWSSTTNPEGSSEASVNITFFYTIARDTSTNFYPFTRPALSFELRNPPPPTTLPPTGSITTKNQPALSSTITDSGDNIRLHVILLCVPFFITAIFASCGAA